MVKHTAERLKALHAAGYVHRDLKPANVMWLPRANRWTVIDFGCVAPVMSQRKAALSVRYAAPEAVGAHRGGRCMVVDESLDAWSLGVLAYELLTGAAWTGMLESTDKVQLNTSVHIELYHASYSYCMCVQGAELSSGPSAGILAVLDFCMQRSILLCWCFVPVSPDSVTQVAS